jgi:hypothetical protein
MAIDDKILQEELTLLKADFDKTKKALEGAEREILNMRNNLNAVYGAMQQTEKLIKLSKENNDGKKV